MKIALRAMPLLVLLILAISQQACTPATERTLLEPTAVVASPNDDRQYRYLELENGMQVLLISDPAATKSAAALSVRVGSYQDPHNREGLAHFLEHMLFLGTEKYPDSGEYSAYLDANGGSHNAYTAYDLTNYYFAVNSGAFVGALDRFAQFFIAPLFTESLVYREKNAVDSEYSTRIGQDSIRRIEAIESEVNPEHPAWKFNAGNLATLSDSEQRRVRDDLLSFYESYYSADQMGVVVLSREPLAELQTIVQQLFTAVPRRDSVPETEFPELFTAGELPKVVEVEPVKEQRALSLIFPMPSMQSHYRGKPLYYIASQIGYEGQGSLHDALKARGWIEWLYAGDGMSYGAQDSFYIGIGLTPEGMKHQDEIIAATFAKIALARDTGIEQWRFNEMRNLAEASFRFREKGTAIEYVKDLASVLHKYPPQDLVRGSSMMERYDPALIADAFSYLRPDNVLINLLAPGVQTNKQTRFYDVNYRAYQPSLERQQRWQQSPVNDLALAGKNPFVPESLALFAEQELLRPVQLSTENSAQVWHYPSHKYGVPKAEIYIALDRPYRPSVEQWAVESLYFALMNEQLNEVRNYASQAGVGFSVGAAHTGAQIRLSGFSDKLPELADAIFSALPNPTFTTAQLERVRLSLLRRLRNYRLETPYKRLGKDLRDWLNADSYSVAAKMAALEKVTASQIEQAPDQLLRSVRVQMMTGGNITEARAQGILRQLYSQLSLTETKAPILLGERVLRLPVSAQRERVAQPIDHNDVAVLRYYQGRSVSLRERAIMSLLAEMMHQPYFQQLRTEQQLGYVVAAYGMNYDRVPGVALLVQSPVASEQEVEQATDQFLQAFHQSLFDMDEQTFATHRDALVTQLQEPAQSLSEEVSRFWSGLRAGYPEFDNRERFITEVATLSQADMLAVVSEVLLTAPRALSMVTPGRASEGSEEPSLKLFREGKTVYSRETAAVN